MKLLTAHDKAQFKELLHELPSLAEELGSNDKASDALFMYLMRLRTGQTYEEIAIHFAVSPSTVQRRLDLVRNILNRVIVPRFLNYEMDREELLGNKSATSKILFDGGRSNCAHLILDGTYIYLEKSSNHRFQKESYNSHKKRNYLKIMMGVLTNGRILFALGPFKATDNDALITEKILSSETPSMKIFTTGDILIVDRGFRDCVDSLMSRGFIVKMPTCSQKSQLSTNEANHSRLVTKVRFEVERSNGEMKSVWKVFSKVIDTHYIPKIMADFQIGAALLNRKFNVTDETRQIELANGMLLRLNTPNLLSDVVNRRSVQTLIEQKKYQQIDDFHVCPQLSISDLEMISFGPYQIVQSRCYISNQVYENNDDLTVFQFFDNDTAAICKEMFLPEHEPMLLLMNLKSRFVSRRVYRVYLLLNKKGIGRESVLQYCCSCKVGNRTIGCCSHVMALLMYVGYSPYVGGIKEVSTHLKKVFEQNNWEIEIVESEDDED